MASSNAPLPDNDRRDPSGRPTAKAALADQALVEEVRSTLSARAAGLWRVGPDRLLQLAFVPSPDLDPEVARAFAEATRTIPLLASQRRLGVVGAVLDGRTCVSIAAELDPLDGSGRWLRAFLADRSVAVPLVDGSGRPSAVFSVALAGPGPTDDDVVRLIQRWAQSWSS